MSHITIVGGGQAGLMLACGLLAHKHKVRLVQNRTADEIASGAVMSSQCVFGTALGMERDLGLDFWEGEAPDIAGMRIRVADPAGSGNMAIGFTGKLLRKAVSVDQRLKFPRWIAEFEKRGGELVIADADVAALETYAADSDLVVVSAGKSDIAALFGRDAERSMYDKPMRALSLVYCHGVQPYEDLTCVTATLIPGAGELFMIPALTASGPCEILFIEALPGGPLDTFNEVRGVDQHLARTLELIAKHVPWEKDRVANAKPTDAQAGLKGRFPPTVRNGHALLPSGKPVLGLADAVILNDPITGQGANNAVKAARVYLDAITAWEGGRFDAEWMAALFEAAWQRVYPSSMWTNMMLQPPPDHVVGLLATAQKSQALADRIANGFDEPGDMLPVYADPALAADICATAA